MFKIFALRLINYRLKLMHLSGIVLTVSSFFLLLFLDKLSDTQTLKAQLILIFMSILMVAGYISMVIFPNKRSGFSLFIFYLLNAATSVLVWATGIFDSPFLLLYPLIIIATSEIYGRGHALSQMIVAVIGFVIIYGGTTNFIFPYETILQSTKSGIIYTSPLVVLIYGFLYVLLIIYASTVSNLPKLYRMLQHVDKAESSNDKILQDLPIAIFVADERLNMHSANPMAIAKFPYSDTKANLANYLRLSQGQADLKKEIDSLASAGKEAPAIWTTDDNNKIPASVKISSYAENEKRYYIVYIN